MCQTIVVSVALQFSASRLALVQDSNNDRSYWVDNADEKWRQANFKGGADFGKQFCEDFGAIVKTALTARVAAHPHDHTFSECNQIWQLA